LLPFECILEKAGLVEVKDKMVMPTYLGGCPSPVGGHREDLCLLGCQGEIPVGYDRDEGALSLGLEGHGQGIFQA